MADWATISALATAGGTLVLAVATFASVRSANRAARTAERAFHANLRPVLFPSRRDDLTQRIRWGDDHQAELVGGGAVVEPVDSAVYLALSLRNAGAGVAVLHGWDVTVAADTTTTGPHPDPQSFRPQLIDLYLPAGVESYWLAALRRTEDPALGPVSIAAAQRGTLFVDLLYSDDEGGQRAISRFVVTPFDEGWRAGVLRHWQLDRRGPR